MAILMSEVFGGQFLPFISVESLVGSCFFMYLVDFDCDIPVDDFNLR